MGWLNFIPNGYMTKISGALMLVGSAGLGADWLAQMIGYDVVASQTTWPMVVATFSSGLGLLGLRRAIEQEAK